MATVVRIKQYDPKTNSYYYINRVVDDSVKTAQQPTRYTTPVTTFTPTTKSPSTLNLTKTSTGQLNLPSGLTSTSPNVSQPSAPSSNNPLPSFNPVSKPTPTTDYKKMFTDVLGTLLKPPTSVSASSGIDKTSNPLAGVAGAIGSAANWAVQQNPYTQFRQKLVEMGAINNQTGNVGELAKNYVSAFTNPRMGSAGTPEFGLSEFLGGGAGGIKFPSIYSKKTEIPTNVISNKGLYDNAFSPTKPDVLGIEDTVNSAYNYNAGAKTGSTLNTMGTNLNTTLQKTQDDLLSYIDRVYADYAANQGNEQELYSNIANKEAEAANAIYNALVSGYKTNVPFLDEQLATDKAYYENLINQDKINRQRAKGNIQQTYGGAIKSITGNLGEATKKMGNIYSALGTTDSSDFLNRNAQLQERAGTDIAQTETEMAGKIADIEAGQAQFENETRRQISTLVTNISKAKQEIMNNINLTEAQRAGALTQINNKLATDLGALAEKYQNAKLTFDNMKINVIQSNAQLMTELGVNQELAQRTQPYEIGQVDTGINQPSSTIIKKKTVRQYNPFKNIYEEVPLEQARQYPYAGLVG